MLLVTMCIPFWWKKSKASKIRMEKTNEKGRIKKKTRATKKNLCNIAVVC